MPQYQFTGDEEREYPTLSLTVQPGETFTLPETLEDVAGLEPITDAPAAKGKKSTNEDTAPTDAPASPPAGVNDASA